MKEAVLAALVLTAISAAAAHSSHSSLPEASSVPGDAFYGLDRAMESVSLALTFSSSARTEKRLKFAEERLAEAQELAGDNRSSQAQRAVEAYTRQMERVNRTSKGLPGDARQEVRRHVNESRQKHVAVLDDVLQKVPEQARRGIRNALENSGPGVPEVPGKAARGGKPVEPPQPPQPTGYVASGKVVPATR